MYRKIYECQVKMWQSDATGKRALKWITMPVEKARQRADVAVRCFECRGPIRLHSLGPRNVPKPMRNTDRNSQAVRLVIVSTGTSAGLRRLVTSAIAPESR